MPEMPALPPCDDHTVIGSDGAGYPIRAPVWLKESVHSYAQAYAAAAVAAEREACAAIADRYDFGPITIGNLIRERK